MLKSPRGNYLGHYAFVRLGTRVTLGQYSMSGRHAARRYMPGVLWVPCVFRVSAAYCTACARLSVTKGARARRPS